MANSTSEGRKNKIVMGIVESVDDPTFSGRIKVRVDGFHDNIPTEQLPWCVYAGSSIASTNGGGSISIPRVGQKVRVNLRGNSKTSMEWCGIAQIDPQMITELKDDYQGSHVLLYDSGADVTIKYQPGSGLVIYSGGSFIQISPDNNIMIHYGEGATGTQIQLSDKRIDIQAQDQINITSSNAINLEAETITLNAGTAVQIAGDKPGECAVNGVQLMTALLALAQQVDMKVPQTAGQATSFVNSTKEGLLNQSIQYVGNSSGSN